MPRIIEYSDEGRDFQILVNFQIEMSKGAQLRLFFMLKESGLDAHNKEVLQNMMLIPIVSRVIQNEENDEVVI